MIEGLLGNDITQVWHVFNLGLRDIRVGLKRDSRELGSWWKDECIAKLDHNVRPGNI
jgi:hypothetical protein